MTHLAIIIGKIISFFGSLLNRGSSLPGKVALSIDSKLLKKMKWPEEVIFITGTNGKTTVTRYLAEIYQAENKNIVTNSEGANMMQGIATQMVNHAQLNLDVPADAVILEVDEGTLPLLMAQVTPTLLVMNNLFPDQEDRFGSADELMAHLNQMIPNHKYTRLLLNGNDPRLVKIGMDHPNNQPLYYGVEAGNFDQPTHHINCPVCGNTLNYSKHYYEHIGVFSCPNGDFATTAIDYLASNIQLKEETLELDGKTYPIPHDNVYTAYNALAAIATAKFGNISDEAIVKGLSKDFSIKGRMDQVTVNGQEVFANLAKNPASFNQSIMAVKNQVNEPFTLLLSVNTRPADGTQPDWIHRCELSALNLEELQEVIVTGEAKETVKEALLAQGFDDEKIKLFEPQEAVEALGKTSTKNFLIANYTALYEIYNFIDK